MMPRVFFLIRSLERGGAERQLVELTRALAKDGYQVTVCTFYDAGALRPELEGVPGLTLVSLGKRGRWQLIRFLVRLHAAVRAAQPDIIHGYLPIANEFALLMARMFHAKAIFGLRSSNMDFSRYDQAAKRSFQVGAVLSRFADALIVNSEAGRAHHSACGYATEHMVVIQNGIDYERYRPDEEARRRVREAWGIRPDERVVGLAARADPKKDHESFLRAAALLQGRHPKVRFVCVGDARPKRRASLMALARDLNLSGGLLWAGIREDMNAVYNAFDIGVLCSAFGEGFPNTVAEAMATGRPCVVTDVGDSAPLVGETGIVIPPRDVPALAAAIDQMLALSNEELAARGLAARERIIRMFNRERLVNATKQVFADVLGR